MQRLLLGVAMDIVNTKQHTYVGKYSDVGETLLVCATPLQVGFALLTFDMNKKAISACNTNGSIN